jgi:hypothetical protein
MQQVNQKNPVDYSQMSVRQLANVCIGNWDKLPRGARALSNHPAGHYLLAMLSLESVDDNYGADSGRSVVAYFLSSASAWRGDVARAVKAELNKRIK